MTTSFPTFPMFNVFINTGEYNPGNGSRRPILHRGVLGEREGNPAPASVSEAFVARACGAGQGAWSDKTDPDGFKAS